MSLSASAIKTSASNCAFCVQDFTSEELGDPTKVSLLFCGHRSHFACKDASIKVHGDHCPTCASTIPAIPIFATDSLSSLYDRVAATYKLNRVHLQLIANSKKIPDHPYISLMQQRTILSSQIWAIQMRFDPSDPIFLPTRVFLDSTNQSVITYPYSYYVYTGPFG